MASTRDSELAVDVGCKNSRSYKGWSDVPYKSSKESDQVRMNRPLQKTCPRIVAGPAGHFLIGHGSLHRLEAFYFLPFGNVHCHCIHLLIEARRETAPAVGPPHHGLKVWKGQDSRIGEGYGEFHDRKEDVACREGYRCWNMSS